MAVVVLAAIASAWLTTLVDNGLGLGWAEVAVRNWEQYGVSALHGKMVCNAGGFEALSHPDCYPGHRPTSLFPVFLCYHFLGGDSLGFLAYYEIVAAMVLLSIWWLLGRTAPAFWLGAIAVIVPGYVRWQTSLDPNLTAVLFGFPFCAAVIALLQRPAFTWQGGALLVVLTAIFSALNWTTVFVHGMLFVTLVALRVKWPRLAFYAGGAAVLAGTVLAVSLASRVGGPGSTGSGGGILSDYTWGNSGYGLGMSTITAVLRLIAANILGLLPLLVYLAWLWWRRGRQVPGYFFLLPAATAAAEVFVMRNYFGHHPWMSIHFILLGLVLSAVVWNLQARPTPEAANPRPVPALAILASTFAYSCVVLAAGHVHNSGELAFASFIAKNTARDTTIIVRRETDPELAGLSLRISNLCDRRFVVLSTDAGIGAAEAGAKSLLLSQVAPPAGKTAADINLADSGSSIMKRVLGWYASHIANRRPGDKLEIPEQKFFLYQPPA